MFLPLFLLTLAFVALAILAMGVNIFFTKKDFPETMIGHNKALRKRKIYCMKTEQVILDKKYKQKKHVAPKCSGC